MAPSQDSQALIQVLQSAMGLLHLEETDDLRHAVSALCDRLQTPNIRIAVFGPFNYGKSTLLNALLGDKAVPMDLVPTTGAPILIRYGEALHTTIRLRSGEIIQAPGTGILEDYAVLDQQRQMRQDVESVEVQCPHEFLKLGVEFLDLPGTDDQAEQNELVHHQLLTANIVIQLLDGRKLMTLSEREHLRDWLLDRGIETVLFVVNFLNLMETDDQKQVMRRMRFVAESFRSKLPAGVSNLYRVDALPALRACLKGDRTQVEASGLPVLETALQTVTEQCMAGPSLSPQVHTVQAQVADAIAAKIQALSATMKQQSQAKQEKKVELQTKAQALIAKSFQETCQTVEEWASPQNLLRNYGRSLTMALIDQQYGSWLQEHLKTGWQAQKQALIASVKKATDFFQLPAPPIPIVQFPDPPQVDGPEEQETKQKTKRGLEEEAAPVAIATGLGWLMGGPVGAAVMGGASYVLTHGSERLVASSQKADKQEDAVTIDLAYAAAAEAYVRQFSQAVVDAIADYQTQTHSIIHSPLHADPSSPKEEPEQHQLTLLRSLYDELTQS